MTGCFRWTVPLNQQPVLRFPECDCEIQARWILIKPSLNVTVSIWSRRSCLWLHLTGRETQLIHSPNRLKCDPVWCFSYICVGNRIVTLCLLSDRGWSLNYKNIKRQKDARWMAVNVTLRKAKQGMEISQMHREGWAELRCAVMWFGWKWNNALFYLCVQHLGH